MGAGCYYTNEYYDKNNKKQSVKAVWLEIDPEDEYDYQYSVDDLHIELQKILNHIYLDNQDIYTNLYRVWFESTYYGDGVIIKQETRYIDEHYLEPDEKKLQALANCNFEKNYYSMINKLCKFGYKFRIATSGYTSGEYSNDSI